MSLLEEYINFIENDVDNFNRQLMVLEYYINPVDAVRISRKINYIDTHSNLLHELYHSHTTTNNPDYYEHVYLPLYKYTEKILREYCSKIPSFQKELLSIGLKNYNPTITIPEKYLSFSVPTCAQLDVIKRYSICSNRSPTI